MELKHIDIALLSVSPANMRAKDRSPDIHPIALARLQRAYDRLPPRHAAIFSAKCHDTMTYAEIAERTGITRLHVERIVADALYRMVRDVEEQERGIEPSPIARFIRERQRNVRLFVRVWRDRF